MVRDSDAIIVGSGPAGLSVAWPLVKAGLKVLMIDAGSGDAPFSDFPSGNNGDFRLRSSSWKTRYGADLSLVGLQGNYSPKLMTPLADKVTGNFAELNGVSAQGFVPIGSMTSGGLSNIWGAVGVVFNETDLREFPFNIAELNQHYANIIRRIGLSFGGTVAGTGTDPATPLGRAANEIFSIHAKMPPDKEFALERASNAVITRDRDDRSACKNCGLCLWGCAHRSIYNSVFELKELRRYSNFDFRPFTRAIRLGSNQDWNFVETSGPIQSQTLSAPVVVLAAGTIATTSLVARKIGYLGRPIRLLSNPAAAIAFVVPKLIGSALPDHGFSLGQLTYEIPTITSSCFGVIYGADTLPLDIFTSRIPLSRPTALRLSRALAPSLLLATCYLPGKFSENRLYVSEQNETPRVLIDGNQTASAKREMISAGRSLSSKLRRRGAFALPRSLTISAPGTDGHYAGTLPMGGKGDLATSLYGELNASKGIYIADGASFSSLPAKHCTLTIMANADRIGHHLISKITMRAQRP
jgi:choline dehydrogenase-like flavoprotein